MVLFKSDDFGCYQNGKFACYQMQNSWYSSPSKAVKKHIEKKKKWFLLVKWVAKINKKG